MRTCAAFSLEAKLLLLPALVSPPSLDRRRLVSTICLVHGNLTLVGFVLVIANFRGEGVNEIPPCAKCPNIYG